MAPARRTTANVDAPVWKSYLAARVEPSAKTAFTTGLTAQETNTTRTRKRAKPSTAITNAIANGGFASKQQLATRASVRSYWEALGLQERLQILMVDHPELVKQLYKLNLSLLCVGLMQRHLKAGTTRTVAASSSGDKAVAPVRAVKTEQDGTQSIDTTRARLSPAAPQTPSSDSAERTYDLLEAMEFMDIGTGILTVKTELVEDVERMFSLVTIVLRGFLTSIHVLSETQFHELFVTESEVINTWEDYERLIAMLVEQLILRSYVVHLEKEATQQMEALLLEVTLDEKGGAETKADASAAAKKKKKKKTKKVTSKAPKPLSAAAPTAETEETHFDSEREPEGEEAAFLTMEIEDFVCNSECSTEDADRSGPSSPVKSVKKSQTNVLNPHAQVFQPAPLAADELKSPVSGKRKLDDFIIRIPWQDLEDELENEDSEAASFLDVMSADDLGCRRPREKQRRREEHAELEWHLQHMYASVSSLYGWDFNHQRETAVLPPSTGWEDAVLWRTDPRDVVRYYFPPPLQQHARAFASARFPPGIVAPHPSAVQPSRYYFSPPPVMADPSSAPARTGYPPFGLPPPEAPVSFWDEHATRTSTAPYSELLEPHAFPNCQPHRSLPRPTKRR